jgi:hypothetical protein
MHRKSVLPALATMIALFLATGLAFAKTKGVTLDRTAKLADGPQLAAGSYKVDVLNMQNKPEVVFYQGKDVVAKVPAKLVAEPMKAEHTEVTYNTAMRPQVIIEIQLSGWKDKLVFSNPTTKSD